MEPNKSSHERKTKKLPYCWLEKEKLRLIEDIFTENTGLGSLESARSIYLAIAEIASDFGRDDNLEISQEAIARRAGLGLGCTTVKRILPIFERLGLVKIKRQVVNGMRTRSIYTLVRGKSPLVVKRLALVGATERSPTIKKEYSEEAFERSVSKTSNSASYTGDSSLADNKENEYERTW